MENNKYYCEICGRFYSDNTAAIHTKGDKISIACPICNVELLAFEPPPEILNGTSPDYRRCVTAQEL